MPIIKRRDGKYLRHLSPLRRAIPYVMGSRNESVVYTTYQIEIENAVAYRKKINRHKKPADRVDLFHILLMAMAQTINAKPGLNRFVSGKRIYERNLIELCFIAKKAHAIDAEQVNVKVEYQPVDTLQTFARKVKDRVKLARSGHANKAERQLNLLMKFPRFVVGTVFKFMKLLDYFNLLPYSLIKTDPLYASTYVANLGSIGLDVVYHHLFEWGNIPVFVVLGKMKPVYQPDANGSFTKKMVMDVSFSLDERITDGFYLKTAIDHFKHLVQNPELLKSDYKIHSPELIAEPVPG